MQSASTSARPLTWSGVFAALRHRNYRLWFFGQLVSLVGTWMQSTAQAFLIYELTRSTAYLGYAQFANGAPSLLFMLYGGVIADRMPRRTLLLLAQTAMMLLAVILAALTFSGLVRPWHILILAFLLGIANAFDAPARQSFVLEMVGREDMTNAIALNSTMFNIGTVVGPAVAGLVYVLGAGWCFALNAVSFLAVIAALLAMRLPPAAPRPQNDSALAEIRAGLRYVRGNVVVRTAIFQLGAVSFFGVGVVALLPAWAVEVLGGGAALNGFLQSARGLGAVAGALTLAAIGGFTPRGRIAAVASLALPFTLLAFSAARGQPLALACMAAVGLAFMSFANSANALVQSRTPDDLRGRVMSIFTFTFFGLMPIGSLVAGEAAERIGEPATLISGACLLLLISALVWLRVPELRRSSLSP
ncbi:MAG: MFS transporter [Chloroflexi bacterium]|nr:MFS transporter [Chloroflexota bacterium]